MKRKKVAQGGMMSASDKQVGGEHYQKQIQPWDAMEAWMSPEEFQGFLWGNIIKYGARWKDKSGIQDLKKLQHYTEKLIEVLEQPVQQMNEPERNTVDKSTPETIEANRTKDAVFAAQKCKHQSLMGISNNKYMCLKCGEAI